LLGPESFAKYKDDNALAQIEREVVVRAALIGNRVEPLSQEQIYNLKIGYLEAYNIENARETIFFDPRTFDYTHAQYLASVLKRSEVNSDVIADAKSYLSEGQLKELTKQLRNQTRMDLQAAPAKSTKTD
jgi:hypothetical protein